MVAVSAYSWWAVLLRQLIRLLFATLVQTCVGGVCQSVWLALTRVNSSIYYLCLIVKVNAPSRSIAVRARTECWNVGASCPCFGYVTVLKPFFAVQFYMQIRYNGIPYKPRGLYFGRSARCTRQSLVCLLCLENMQDQYMTNVGIRRTETRLGSRYSCGTRQRQWWVSRRRLWWWLYNDGQSERWWRGRCCQLQRGF